MQTPRPKSRAPKKKRMTKAMRRERLEKATAAYFASLSGEDLREEQELERAVASACQRVDFDADY